MNELLDDLSPEDGAVIARVRAALDEVTAHDHDHDHDQAHGVVPVELQRSGIGAGRWFAIAAAAVLVVGAVTAIAVNRSNTPDVASIPTETSAAPSTAPDDGTRSRSPRSWSRSGSERHMHGPG